MKYHLNLHERHGSLVRIGPKHVSFSDSNLIPQIYSISSKFYKVRASLRPMQQRSALICILERLLQDV